MTEGPQEFPSVTEALFAATAFDLRNLNEHAFETVPVFDTGSSSPRGFVVKVKDFAGNRVGYLTSA